MIKNIKNLKNIQIVCKNQEQVKDCLNYLEQLGFKVEFWRDYGYLIISFDNEFGSNSFSSKKYIDEGIIEFYNKELVKTLQKFIKQKEEKGQVKEEEKVKDFEVAEDGRIIKINNWGSEKCLYFIGAWDYGTINFDDFKREGFEYYIKLGLVYSTKEARDRAMFKLEIETKLKNIAERLNKGQKIDWEDKNQGKYFIHYDYNDKELDWYIGYCSKHQGIIYCLDRNFLDVAKQEIGEDNLIKYFKE